MGVIQSGINQAISAAGETIRDVKLLGKAGELTQGQDKIVDEQKQVAKNVLYTEEQKRERQIKNAQLDEEERAKRLAKIREEIQRERERRSFNERQSMKNKIRNLKDWKEHERLRNSPLGGDFNV